MRFGHISRRQAEAVFADVDADYEAVSAVQADMVMGPEIGESDYRPDGVDSWSVTLLIGAVDADLRRNPPVEPTSWMRMSEEERVRIRARRRGHLRLVEGGAAGAGVSPESGEAA
jgi:hypothetical protein